MYNCGSEIRRIAESQHVTLHNYAAVLNRLTNHNYTSHSGSKVYHPDDLRLGRTPTLRLHASSASPLGKRAQ